MLSSAIVNLKCPFCGKSLMDKEHLVDNKPGIHVKIKFDNQEGDLRLSSIYGNYNFESSIEPPIDTIVQFFCPHCSAELKSERKCELCGAPMIPFCLIEGGYVYICSRQGCKKHYIEFEEMETALRHFCDEFAYGHLTSFENPKPKSTLPIEKSEEEVDKKIVKTGTYLNLVCPNCKKSLIEHNMLKLRIKKQNGESSFLMLNPYFNTFSHMSAIHLPKKIVLKDILCFHCDESLIEKGKKCPICGAQVIKVSVSAMSKIFYLFVCSKTGYIWHKLYDENLQDIMLQDSNEW